MLFNGRIMMNILKLIRIQNLFIVFFTMYCIRYCILFPIFKLNGMELQLSGLLFFLLVLSTSLITASGYIINDYFDRKTDLINRPNSVVVGIHIKRRFAMILHIVFNVIAVLLATYVSYKIGQIKYSFIFLLTVGILWYYSTTYKRIFLLGNFTVAVLTAMIPILVYIYDVPLIFEKYKDWFYYNIIDITQIKIWILGFSVFAFILTLIREIIKDIEDFNGDIEYGRSTLPIKLGIQNTKFVLMLLIISTILLIAYSYSKFISDNYSVYYFALFLVAPLLYLINVIMKATEKKHYYHASLITKFIMILGILYSFIIFFNFYK